MIIYDDLWWFMMIYDDLNLVFVAIEKMNQN